MIDRAIERGRMRQSLSAFVLGPAGDGTDGAWSVVEPSTPLVWGWSMQAVCDALQDVAAGRILNLIINIPPGHSKSLLANVFFPAWLWLSRPGWRGLFASYSADLTLRDAYKCRTLIQSDWYQRTFMPEWQIKGDRNAIGYYENTATGSRLSLSVGSMATGWRGDGMILDDLLNAASGESEAERNSTNFWWDQAMGNRLNDLAKGFRVMIGQRLHQEDPPGHVMRREPGKWTLLRLPTEFEPADADPRDKRTVEGELLFPERFPAPVIADEKRRLGSSGFAGQHQQRPSPLGGGKFRKSWFRYFADDGDYYTLRQPLNAGPVRVMKSETWLFQTADLAMSEKEDACFTVIATWAVTKHNDLLLIDLLRERLAAPEAEAALLAAMSRWKPVFQAVEKAHYGVAICQKFIRMGLPLKELIADRDKITRSKSAEVMMENGKIYFRETLAGLVDYEDELQLFPNGQYDDQVDVTSYAALLVANAGVQAADVMRQQTAVVHTVQPINMERPRRRAWNEVAG